MARRRTKFKQKRHNSNKRKKQPLAPIARDTLFALFQAAKPLSQQDLIKRMKKTGYLHDEISEEIARLTHLNLIESKGKNKQALNSAAGFLTATLEMKPAGFGFAIDLRSLNGKKLDSEDPYISRSALFSARHRDRILILISPNRRRKNPEAVVVGILEHGAQTLTGFFQEERGRFLVYPEDPRFPFIVEIRHFRGSIDKPENGDAVIIKLSSEQSVSRTNYGTIIEILGNPDRLEVQMRMVIEKHQLPFQFSSEALGEAERVLDQDIIDRQDLRDILHYTIDGADAKDFDDAVAVEKLTNGYRLYVSIADVSAYVNPGSRLDKEAYERGTSVYFPSAVIPMLPENISNNICSLLANEERMTVTAILDFDGQGILVKKRFVRSKIISRMRFTYDTVQQIVVDKNKEIRQNFKPFLTPLKWAAELAKALENKRNRRGSIALSITEPYIRIGSDGEVTEIGRKQRSFANQIIEEFMLAANEAIAETFVQRGLDLLYRIHEQPDQEKINEFIELSGALGLELPGIKASPLWYNELVAQVQNTPRQYIVNNQLLRTLQQARYSDTNKGHFGLGAPNYTHFTSPIRRYPDLIVHRLLGNLISNNPSDKAQPCPCRSLKEAGLHLSEKERSAVAAERDMANRLKCRYMQTRIGEHFQAIVSSLTDTLFFVDLLEYFVSGGVLLSSLTGDYYLHDWKNHRLIGDISGKIIQIGDIIEVRLIDVETTNNKIFFTPVDKSSAPENTR